MMDRSDNRDRQWSELLTRCHGGNVEADATFKAELLRQLKERTAQRSAAGTTESETEAPREDNWRTLLTAAYIPCHHRDSFKADLFERLKAKQAELSVAVPETAPDQDNEDAIRAILAKSYQPITPRRDFQTRLLVNLKERQKSTTIFRRRSRRRAIFMSAASSVAAAAMIMITLWVMPDDTAIQQAPAPAAVSEVAGIHLSIPEAAMHSSGQSSPLFVPASFSDNVAPAGTAVPAAYTPEDGRFSSYRVADVFSSHAHPEKVVTLNVQIDAGEGWNDLAESMPLTLASGQSFRSDGGMGHLNFSDGSLMTLSPDSIVFTTGDGIAVKQGFVLVAVPETAERPFRIHFPERDLAVAPGTDIAMMVEKPELYAEGGAPAPLVMVVDTPGKNGGLAFARGKNGVGPLFPRQLYRLDNYVTPDLPSRTLCDIECQDLDKLFKEETVYERRPFASFAGGFAADRDLSYARTVLVPAGFAKKGDRWVADSYANQPTIRLRYLSDAYFAFVNERRDLSRALSLGSRVIIDGGDGRFYEIYK